MSGQQSLTGFFIFRRPVYRRNVARWTRDRKPVPRRVSRRRVHRLARLLEPGLLPQQGYKVTYSPFDETQPAGDHEVFADGFAGADTLAGPGEAEYRPRGLAVGPEGCLYASDDVQGRIWRITYVGTDN